jgi:valyl-tRNA synthetase
LIHAWWPEPTAGIDAAAKSEIDWVKQLVENLRKARIDNGIAPIQKVHAYVRGLSDYNRKRFLAHMSFVGRQVRFSGVHIDEADYLPALGPNAPASPSQPKPQRKKPPRLQVA